MARRSIRSEGSSVGAPQTWQRKPCSAKDSENEMPDLASRSDAWTSPALLPMDDTTPRPVTTTRLMPSSLACRRSGRGLLEQADSEVGGLVNGLSVGLQPAVADAEHQSPAHHALEVDTVFDFPVCRRHHAGKLDFAGRQRASLARLAEPAEKKAHHLPQCVQPEAPGHHRILDEMAGKEPEVGTNVEFGANEALVEFAAALTDRRDAVEHQHRRVGELGIAGPEQLAPRASQQIVIIVAGLRGRHEVFPLWATLRSIRSPFDPPAEGRVERLTRAMAVVNARY